MAAVLATDLVILCTIDAFRHPGQMQLAHTIAALERQAILVALRMPTDAEVLDDLPTALACYSIHDPSTEAMAAVIFGEVAAIRPGAAGRYRPITVQPDAGGRGPRTGGVAMSLHEEIHEQPDVAQRLLTGQRAVVERIADGDRGPGHRPGAHRGARQLGPRRHLRPVPVRRAAPHPGRTRGAGHHLGLRGDSPGWSTRWSSASRSPAARPTWWASWTPPGPRVRRPSPSPTSPTRRWRVPSDHVIDIGAGQERATAATKTYTMSLLAVAMLAAAIDGGTGFAGDRATRMAALDALPGVMGQALGGESHVEAVAASRADLDRCIVLGRGFEYATAREWALKLKELAQVAADPVFRGRLPARPAGARGAGLSHPGGGADGCHARGHVRAAAATPGRVRCGPAWSSPTTPRPRRSAAAAPADARRRLRNGSARSCRPCRHSCSRTT